MKLFDRWFWWFTFFANLFVVALSVADRIIGSGLLACLGLAYTVARLELSVTVRSHAHTDVGGTTRSGTWFWDSSQ